MFSLGFTASDFVRACWVFVFAFLASFFTLATGVGPITNLAEAKAALWAVLPAAIAAALGAAKNFLLADGSLKG